MPKFISIPGMSHSNTGDPDAHRPLGHNPRAEEFYAAREKRRRQGGEVFSGFSAGDRETFRGESVVVEGREYDQHRHTETLWLRGDRSGTFTTEWSQTGDGRAEISKAKRTHE